MKRRASVPHRYLSSLIVPGMTYDEKCGALQDELKEPELKLGRLIEIKKGLAKLNSVPYDGLVLAVVAA